MPMHWARLPHLFQRSSVVVAVKAAPVVIATVAVAIAVAVAATTVAAAAPSAVRTGQAVLAAGAQLSSGFRERVGGRTDAKKEQFSTSRREQAHLGTMKRGKLQYQTPLTMSLSFCFRLFHAYSILVVYFAMEAAASLRRRASSSDDVSTPAPRSATTLELN